LEPEACCAAAVVTDTLIVTLGVALAVKVMLRVPWPAVIVPLAEMDQE
jgi:hypothetical protein